MDCFHRIPSKYHDFHNQGLSFVLTCTAQLKISHLSSALDFWDELDDSRKIKPFPSTQVSLSQAERTVFASTNRRVAGENCMCNKAAASASKKKTSVKPLFFYLWWLQAVLGTLLSHSSWQSIWCSGLKVNASSHFIYGSSLWQNRAFSLSFFQAGHASWSNFRGCPPNGLCCGWGFGAGIRLQPL